MASQQKLYALFIMKYNRGFWKNLVALFSETDWIPLCLVLHESQ
jgi:hypothetical protein